MTKAELVYEVLNQYSCVSAKELSMWIKRTKDIDMSPQSVSGVLRTLTVKGKVGCSNCGNGATVYWCRNDNWKKVRN